MVDGSPIPVQVGRCGGGMVIRPAGPCTVLLCDRLRSYLENLGETEISDLYVDLSAVDWLDSTFAGFLVSLAVGRNCQLKCPVHLLKPCAGALEALERMHLLRVFNVADQLTEEPAEWTELPEKPASEERVADLVIQAHENLIEADPRNAPAFRPVLDGFRADKEKRDRRPGDH